MSGSSYNVAQFQSNPQLLQLQEILLRNPQLLGQVTQQLQQSQQPTNNQQSNQSLEQLRKQNQALQEEVRRLRYIQYHQNQYNQNLSNHAELGNLGQIALTGMAEQIDHAVEMAIVGGEALNLITPLINQVYDQQEMIEVMETMLRNPWYLLIHSFETWYQSINAEDSGFIELLSQAYSDLIAAYEELHRKQYGNYSPQYTDYLNSQSQPSPQVQYPQQEGRNQASEHYKNLAIALKSPGAAKEMQRQHAMYRQMAQFQ